MRRFLESLALSEDSLAIHLYNVLETDVQQLARLVHLIFSQLSGYELVI